MSVNKIIASIAFIIVVIGFGYVYIDNQRSLTEAHESAHAQIAIQHGCSNYTININKDLSGNFSCLDFLDSTKYEERLQIKFLNSLNEIVDYQVSTLKDLMFICFLFVGVVIFIASMAGEGYG